MGKQFRVYLLPSDVTKLLDALRASNDLLLLGRESENSSPRVLESPLVTEAGITRADCLLVADPSMSISMDRTKRGVWSIDTLVSEVIEFNACYCDGKTIKQGRLYYNEGFYNDTHVWQEKSLKFLRWAGAIFRVAKRFLIKMDEMTAYSGEDAARWRRDGGIFIAYAVKGSQPIIAGRKKTKKGTA